MRPEKHDYYLNIAKEVARRGTCLRRRYGAVLVKDDQIISTGYVGSPRGAKNCTDIGTCHRKERDMPKGFGYELCRSVHAEMNALINAARSGVVVLGGRLYLYGEDLEDNNKIVEAGVCILCKRALINAGIIEVIVKLPEGFRIEKVSDWLNDVDAEIKS
jgi:dCMP deaminase